MVLCFVDSMVRCDLTMCASSKIIIHFEFRIP